MFSNNHGLDTENDYGAAIVISLLTIFRQRITVPRHEIIDWYEFMYIQCVYCLALFLFNFSIFLRNRGLNGIVSIGYAPTSLRGSNYFIENDGASLRVRIILYIINNTISPRVRIIIL